MLIIFGVLFFVWFLPSSQAATLNWDASTGTAGYLVSYKTLAATTYTVVDVGNVITWTIPTSLIKGTRYEFFIQAYAGTPKSYWGESNHIRVTVPRDPIIIEIPEDVPIQLRFILP